MTIKTRTLDKAVPLESKAPRRARKPSTEQIDKAKQLNMVAVESAVQDAIAPLQAQSVSMPDIEQSVTGRGGFAVRTLGNTVSVQAAFLAQDGNVLSLPAVFPNRQYALEQIDELRKIVIQHFDALEDITT